MHTRTLKLDRFSIYAWLVLIYNLAVILWGAFVRATGSGAGCGGHWPDCNGVVIPVAPQLATIIEFAHRTTSGVSLVLVAVLLVWAWLRYPKGHIVRLGAAGSVFFIITEALVGAGLVLFGWVAKDTSVYRPIADSVHLVNTFFLLAMLTLTAWWASGGARVQLRGQGAFKWALAAGLVGVMVIAVTGTVTALGDTLFPAGSLAEGLQQDASATASFLIRLRVIHPILAIAVGGYLLFLLSFLGGRASHAGAGRLEWTVRALVFVQIFAVAINVILLAPIWMQLVHLLLADLVWIALVLYSASLLNAELVTAPANAGAGGPVSAPAE